VPAIFVVNHTADDTVFVPSPTGGEGSLRACIQQVNLDTSDNDINPDLIRFNIPGSGMQTIQPASPLPIISRAVVIDGYTQPGAQPNTLTVGDNANILIELKGNLAPSNSDGLSISSFSTIRGLKIDGFGSGVNVQGDANQVQGNFLIGNFLGVFIDGTHNGGAHENLIGMNGGGVDDVGDRNVISGNTKSGIVMDGASENHISGNYIGTLASGQGSPQSQNGGFGVFILEGGKNNIIGGDPSRANIIAFNQSGGVAVADPTSTGNTIRVNSIYDNQSLDIDLGDDGVTLNTPNSPHTGPNNLQSFPIITSASPGLGTLINGTLNSAKNTAYTIDFYASALPGLDTFQGETYGGGQRWLGSITANTDNSGNAVFSSGLLSASTLANEWVTATATDPAGNTSEFSIARQLPVQALNAGSWTNIGPASANGTGRVDVAVPDPRNANVMYVGAIDGGIWKTSNWLDPYPAWTPLVDVPQIPSQSLSIHEHDLVVVPGDRTMIFAAASGPGGGILRSVDDGNSWSFLANDQFDLAEFGALVADPNIPSGQFYPTLYAAVSGGAVDGGVYQSTDGGANWTNMTPPNGGQPAQGPVSDLLVMQEHGKTVLYGAFTGDGAISGIYKSDDGFQGASLLSNGLPIGTAVGAAVRLAGGGIMPNESIYATIVDPSYTPTRYRSDDAGVSWLTLPGITKKTNGNTVSDEDTGAITYNSHVFRHMLLTVDPANPMTVFASGLEDVYESGDGGIAWKFLYADDPTSGTFDFATSRGFVAAGDNGINRVTGDRGIDGGKQAAPTVTPKNGNLSTVQFYTFTVDPTNAQQAYGNAQDYPAVLPYTGTHVWGYQPPFNQNTGEAGKVRVDPVTGKVYYFDPNLGTRFQYSTNGGKDWTAAVSGLPFTVSNGQVVRDFGFYGAKNAFVMDPNYRFRLLLGLHSVFETTTGGDPNGTNPAYYGNGWRDIGALIPGSGSTLTITALAIANSDPNTIYAGTADGHIYSTSDASDPNPQWSEVDGGLPLNNESVWDIKIDPTSPQHAIAVTSPWVDRDAKAADLRAHPHVWMTITAGAHWAPIDHTLPTGTPLPAELGGECLAVDWNAAPVALYVGTLRGVWKTTDNGEHWAQEASVPNTMVTDLDIAPDLGILGAGTLGRGAYEILLDAPVPRTSSMNPSNVVKGSPSRLLTVGGVHFLTTSRVQINGRAVPTTFVDDSDLQATIDSSFFATGAASLSITVFTPGPGGGTSDPLTLTITDTPLPDAFAASAGAPNFAGQLVGSGQGVGTDAAGNVYTVGYIGGTINASDTDGYVAKYSANGVLEWKQVVQGLDADGNSFADSADVIAVDSAGNSYVAGTFRLTLHLGNFTITSTGPLDVFVEKLDTNGNVLWVHQLANTGNFGPPTFDHLATCSPKSIAIDSAGEVVVAGTFTGHMDTDPANPGQHFLDYPAPGQSGHPDGYLVKLHADGSFAWEAQVVNVPRDGINMDAVAMDGPGNVYALGTFANDNYFNDATANNSIQQNASSIFVATPQGLANVNTLFLWKLNADGTNAFVRPITSQPDPTDPFAGFTATGPRASIWGLGLAIDAQGNIYATGAFNGKSVDFSPGVSFPGNPTSGPNIVTSPYGNYDTFVEKMDSAGNWQWVSQIVTKTAGDNWGTALALDSAGDAFITGYVSADSLLGNILLTPASAAGNSYIAELSPQGEFLHAQKSVNRSPDGDRAAAIAVDSLGFVDIVGTYAASMQWPALPALASPGGSDMFTVKTMLTFSTVTPKLNGTLLYLTGTDQANRIVIADDRRWGIVVELDYDPLWVYSNLTQIDVTSGNGNDEAAVLLGSVTPPNLRFHFGNGNDALSLMADYTGTVMPSSGSWTINTTAGNGTDMVHTLIFGSVPVALTTTFGSGHNTSENVFADVEDMLQPSTVTVHGGSSVNDIKVFDDFKLQPEPSGAPQASPITVTVEGPGTNVVDIENTFQPTSAGGPGDPPTFLIPLSTRIHGTGSDTVHAGYHFVGDPNIKNGIIAILAPISLDISGAGIKSAQVAFDSDSAPPGRVRPILEIGAALTFNVHGGDTGDFISLLWGSLDQIGNPDLMPSGSLNVRLAAGSGNDTISARLWLDPRSTGLVTAMVFGGAGDDDLRLDVYGIDNPDLLTAVINGGTGRNTAHATSNVRVVNCDTVFIDP
jgi:hypothetical protein